MDFQESSPAPQFEGIDSLGLCFLHSLAFTTVCDHWEDHSLDYREFVIRVMFLLFNTVFRFVIAFLPRSNCLLISWWQLPSAVIWEPKKRKSVTPSTFFAPREAHNVFSLRHKKTNSCHLQQHGWPWKVFAK